MLQRVQEGNLLNLLNPSNAGNADYLTGDLRGGVQMRPEGRKVACQRTHMLAHVAYCPERVETQKETKRRPQSQKSESYPSDDGP